MKVDAFDGATTDDSLEIWSLSVARMSKRFRCGISGGLVRRPASAAEEDVLWMEEEEKAVVVDVDVDDAVGAVFAGLIIFLSLK
jgi:hypothetical protein